MDETQEITFAEDLRLTGVSVAFERSDFMPNYSVIAINGIRFCFRRDDGRYDGWYAEPGAIYDNTNESIETILGDMGDRDG